MAATPHQSSVPKLLKDEPGFRTYVRLFKKLNATRDPSKLKQVGGVKELAKGIGVDLTHGVDTSSDGQKLFSIKDRKEIFETNEMEQNKRTTDSSRVRVKIYGRAAFLVIITLILYIGGMNLASSVKKEDWRLFIAFSNMAFFSSIICAVLVHMVTQLLLLEPIEEDLYVAVVRDGIEQRTKSSDVVVGDVLVLTNGSNVPADGVLFAESDLLINEDIITGESTPVKKKLVEDPFCRFGTQVTNGSGRILVTGVGEDTELGQTLQMVASSTNNKNEWTSTAVRYFFKITIAALCLGIISFIVLLIRWKVSKNGSPAGEANEEGPGRFLDIATWIILFEFPEGIVIATILLLFSVYLKRRTGGIFIRPNIARILWMPFVRSICFDKTGTLTENKMKVVEGWFNGTYFDHLPIVEELDSRTLELITENACLNSEAFFQIEESGMIRLVGNQTEGALLAMAKEFEVDYAEVRMHKREHTIKSYVFNSDKKMSSVIIKHEDLLRMYNKGAAEMVLDKCTEYIDPSGSKCPISELLKGELERRIKRMASRGLRTLALTYNDLDLNDFNFNEDGEPLDETIDGKRGFGEALEEGLVLLAIVGIKDPVRREVSELVYEFNKADITVRLMTGDSLESAKHVARLCGILTSEGFAMEGAEFRQRDEEDIEGLMKDLPQLQVLARSSPHEKQKLVELLKSIGEKVAVVGDGTNDALALKESNVGIAMGTESTSIARNVADVLILNDDLSSILTVYLWSLHKGISFLTYICFRLGLSIVVWIVVLVSIGVGGETPLDFRQFYWANFIIDWLVPAAFALERPPAKVPDDDIYKGKSPDHMTYFLEILLQSLYQIIVILCTFYSLSSFSERYEAPVKDEFYYHYCYDGLSNGGEYKDSPVQSYCDQYLECDTSRRVCSFIDDLGSDHDFRQYLEDAFEDEYDTVKMRKHSLMLNIFVLMPLFNALNYKKLPHAYNTFEGLFNSLLWYGMVLSIISLQVVLVSTSVGTLYRVTRLNAWEWLYSLSVSVGIIPFNIFIRYMLKDKRLSGIDLIQTLIAYVSTAKGTNTQSPESKDESLED